MSLDALRDQLPDYAKDIRLNLGSLAGETVLNDQQKWGTFLATALASGNATVIKAITAEVQDKLSPEAITAAKGANSMMGMNNVYYRFVHLVSEKTYGTIPAKLRMQFIGNPGVDKVDFELWCLAISAVNGCGLCLDSHDSVCRKGGMTTEQVQASVRIAATVHAAAATLTGEEALSS